MSSPLPPHDSVELHRLIQALHDEVISPEEEIRLAEWLLRDEAAREFYVQYMYLYARLRWDRRCDSEPDPPLLNGQPAPTQSPILGHLGNAFWTGVEFIFRPLVMTLMLTVGLPGLFLLILAVDLSHQTIENPHTIAKKHNVADAPVAVAQITKTLQPVWELKNVLLSVGTTLASGESIHLLEGLSEIEFADGACVVLEGPAIFEIRGRNAAFLRKGSLVASVGPAARGFSIDTPLATIVDLGTEFGLSVAADGKEETHVFKGEVTIETGETEPNAGKPLRQVRAGKAMLIRLAQDGRTVQTKEITSAPDRFVHRVPPESNAGLPEPRIVFSHQGDRDPTAEGWAFLWEPKKAPRLDNIDLKPVTEDGVAAWSINDRSTKMGVTYRVVEAQGMNQEMVAKARSCGWVIRARIKLSTDGRPGDGLGFLSYWDGSQAWRLHPTVDEQGNQALIVFSKSSLGNNAIIHIPNSRDRYVDYEVRYYPKTNDADIYIDGRLAVTKVSVWQRSIYSLHFGTLNPAKTDIRFARVEWGILDNTPRQEKELEKEGNDPKDPS